MVSNYVCLSAENITGIERTTDMLLFRSHYPRPTIQLPHSEEIRLSLHFEDFGTEGRHATCGFWYAGLQIKNVQLLRQGERE